MEPRIQYAKTKDGVSIAFWTLGEGMPFVHKPFPYSHLQLDWEATEGRSWGERLAKNRQLVCYDIRSTWLYNSRRDQADSTIPSTPREATQRQVRQPCCRLHPGGHEPPTKVSVKPGSLQIGRWRWNHQKSSAQLRPGGRRPPR